MPPPRRSPDAGGPKGRARAGPAAMLAASIALGAAAPAAGAAPSPRDPGPTDLLERAWPGHPEWLAMLAEILGGRAPEPDAGWYRKGTSRLRFGWAGSAGRFDRDRDGAIARGEFPGTALEFGRLDRDRDGRLTRGDLDPTADRPGGSSGLEPFATADGDGDGTLSRREFGAFARSAGADPVYRLVVEAPCRELEARLAASEREGPGSLTLADFQEAFGLDGGGSSPLAGPAWRPARGQVDGAALLLAFLRQEIGAFGAGPDLDAPAPDFRLPTADGGGEFHLAGRVGPRPIVLIFGNASCGPFRAQAGSLERLVGRYGDRADFVAVYTREAHPAGGWRPVDDRVRGVAFDQPRDGPGRSAAARACRKALRLGMPVLVDSMDDRVGRLYSGMPARLYLIDRLGRVAYKGGRGPFGFKPAELERSLILLLNAGPPAGGTPAPEAGGGPEPSRPRGVAPEVAKADGWIGPEAAWAGPALAALALVAAGIGWGRRRAAAPGPGPPGASGRGAR